MNQFIRIKKCILVITPYVYFKLVVLNSQIKPIYAQTKQLKNETSKYIERSI